MSQGLLRSILLKEGHHRATALQRLLKRFPKEEEGVHEPLGVQEIVLGLLEDTSTIFIRKFGHVVDLGDKDNGHFLRELVSIGRKVALVPSRHN